MASAERIDESDILFLQREQPRWIIHRSSQVRWQNCVTRDQRQQHWRRYESAAADKAGGSHKSPFKKLLKMSKDVQFSLPTLPDRNISPTLPQAPSQRKKPSTFTHAFGEELGGLWGAPKTQRHEGGQKLSKWKKTKNNFHTSGIFLKSTKKLTALSGRWEFLFPVCDPAERRGCVVTAVRQSGFI